MARILSEREVIVVTPKGLKFIERAPVGGLEEIIKATDARVFLQDEIPG